MKKIFGLIMAMILAFSCVMMASAENLPVVKIGVYEPASGDSGAGGKQETLGVQYANVVKPTVTIGGVEYKVELVTADNGSSTDKAPSAAQKLVSENVSVVLGSVFCRCKYTCDRSDLYQSSGNGRQQPLFQSLLPGSVPGNCSRKLCV